MATTERGWNIIDNNLEEIYSFNIAVTVEKYYSEESSWGTYLFSTKDDIPYFTSSAKDINDDNKEIKYCTLAGNMQHLEEGAEYLVKARYSYHKQYGHQYNPISVYALIPESNAQQAIFLKAILNSERIANNLLEQYPNLVNDVINGSLKEIDYSKVQGVREYTWNRVREKILNNYLISDIISMLKPLGITFKMIRKLVDNEPNPSLLKKSLEENPYLLTKIRGLGFKKVDEFALKFKPDLLESKERLVAFVKYYFMELGESDGHTWVSIRILKDAITNTVPECMQYIEWLYEQNNFIHIEDGKIGLERYQSVEMEILDIIRRKIETQLRIVFTKDEIEDAIAEAEEEQGFSYSDEQRGEVHNILNRSFSILTAKAGAGKTTVMRAVLIAFRRKGRTITCCALSAMAAQRISEATGFSANTIHRTLGADKKGFLHNEDNQLITSLAFMDECSMVNAPLFLSWLKAVNDYTMIVLCGDPRQLPPIGYGNIFSDLIDLLKNNCVSELTKPQRQALDSGILTDANIVRDNLNPISEAITPKIVHGKLKDMYYMFRDSRDAIHSLAVKMYLKAIETDGVDNVVIATPRKDSCINSAKELNDRIQKELLSDVEEEIIGLDNTVYKLGAKVMHVNTNDYERNVCNGENGYITRIYEEYEGKQKKKFCDVTYIDIVSKNEKIIKYSQADLKDLVLAYAITVHKLQGADRKTVVCVTDNTHYRLLDSTMLYTQLTRAKHRCLLVAEKSAFLQCIRKSHNMRNTWLQLECKTK